MHVTGDVVVEHRNLRLEWEQLESEFAGDDPAWRFTVYERTTDPEWENGWMPLDDCSYCTEIVDAEVAQHGAKQLAWLAVRMLDVVADAIPFRSPKKVCEWLSWVSINDLPTSSLYGMFPSGR